MWADIIPKGHIMGKSGEEPPVSPVTVVRSDWRWAGKGVGGTMLKNYTLSWIVPHTAKQKNTFKRGQAGEAWPVHCCDPDGRADLWGRKWLCVPRMQAA